MRVIWSFYEWLLRLAETARVNAQSGGSQITIQDTGHSQAEQEAIREPSSTPSAADGRRELFTQTNRKADEGQPNRRETGKEIQSDAQEGSSSTSVKFGGSPV